MVILPDIEIFCRLPLHCRNFPHVTAGLGNCRKPKFRQARHALPIASERNGLVVIKRNYIDLSEFKHRFSKPYNFGRKRFHSVGAPTGSSKMICAEFALLRLWNKPKQLPVRAVCIEPYQERLICVLRNGHRNSENSKEGRRSLA
jgi:hypothetical protein